MCYDTGMKTGSVSTEPYKGVRDFYPEDMRVQNYIFSVWRKVAEKFGYEEYGASILEYADLYKSKGNEEIINEQTYTFTDRGEREVTLRPEMTPTLARMVAARRKSMKFPLRWFSIPNVFRYERPQRGRRREHWQLNCDLVGLAGIEAEVEIISLASEIMKAFGAKNEDFEIKVNIRPKLDKEILSKWDKQGVPDADKTQCPPHISEIIKLLNLPNVKFDANIVRGFDYYTEMVFEVFDTNPENRRSLFGGGRYDNLLEIFGVEPVPCVGFGMGDITIRDFLETHSLRIS